MNPTRPGLLLLLPPLFALGCVERRLSRESVDALPSAESFRIELEQPVERSLSERELAALRRVEHLIRSGFHDRAKAELGWLSQRVEDRGVQVQLERLDRYLDGHLAHEWLRDASALEGPERASVGEEVELAVVLFNPGASDLVLCAESEEAPSDRERSFLRVRLQEVEFGGLGGETHRVRSESVPIEADVPCLAGSRGQVRWRLPAFADTGFAVLLVRVEVVLYPAAVRLVGREVPMRPLRVGQRILRIYPRNWELVERDPLAALRASCATDAEAFDRHALIAASLLRTPEQMRPAFAWLDQVIEEGSERARAKARACLAWLRGRPEEPALWKDVPLAGEPARPDGDATRLDLPTRRR